MPQQLRTASLLARCRLFAVEPVPHRNRNRAQTGRNFAVPLLGMQEEVIC